MADKFNTVYDCQIIKLNRVENSKGNLTPVEGNIKVPFNIARIYYLYDVPGGETRGGHAHKELEQFIISVSGSFDIILDDSIDRKTIKLNRSHYGLYVPKLIWREIVNFSTGAICLVIASEKYNELEYIRDYNEFLDMKHVLKNAI